MPTTSIAGEPERPAFVQIRSASSPTVSVVASPAVVSCAPSAASSALCATSAAEWAIEIQ